MVPALGLDDVADLSLLQLERDLLEGFLHLPALEEAQISSPLAARALRELGGNLPEEGWIFLQLILETADIGDGLFPGASDWLVAEGVDWPSGLLVLLEDVCAVDRHFTINIIDSNNIHQSFPAHTQSSEPSFGRNGVFSCVHGVFIW